MSGNNPNPFQVPGDGDSSNIPNSVPDSDWSRFAPDSTQAQPPAGAGPTFSDPYGAGGPNYQGTRQQSQGQPNAQYSSQYPYGQAPPAQYPSGTYPAQGIPPYGYQGAPQPPAAYPPTDGVSVASMVTSLVGLNVVGIILGIVGLGRTRDGQRKGRGFAIAGLIIGTISLVLMILGGAFLATYREGNSSSRGRNSPPSSSSPLDSAAEDSASDHADMPDVQSDDAAPVVVPSPTDEECVGYWIIDSMISEGQPVTSADLDELDEFGIGMREAMTLELMSTGEAEFSVFGEPMSGSWSPSTQGCLIDIDFEALDGTLENGLLTVVIDSQTTVMFRQG